MDLGSGTSKYVAVRTALLERISAMSVGEKLPSETVLCWEFGVSRITLRHAVDGLVLDGRLAREHGRGTFVTEPPKGGAHYPERFADVVTGFHRQQTVVGNTVASRVLRQGLVPADARLADTLGLPIGARAVELERLRFVNAHLHQHVVTYLPYDRYPETLTADFGSGSLYDFLHERYGVSLTRNDLVVRVEEATPEIALNLAVPNGLRLLAVASTVYDGDEPVAFGIARHSPEESEIALILQTAPALAQGA